MIGVGGIHLNVVFIILIDSEIYSIHSFDLNATG